MLEYNLKLITDDFSQYNRWANMNFENACVD